jgi:predicted RNA binding protein YcfA (HicA-like mRNA interferase family)
MSRLPRISGRECAKALEKVGFYLKRQEGSHIVLRRDDPFAQVVVPDHRELDTGTLRAVIGQTRKASVADIARYLRCQYCL